MIGGTTSVSIATRKPASQVLTTAQSKSSPKASFIRLRIESAIDCTLVNSSRLARIIAARTSGASGDGHDDIPE
jgi:hypothetical protein